MIKKYDIDVCCICGAIFCNLDEILEKREPNRRSIYFYMDGEKEIVSEKCDLGICNKIRIVVKLCYKEKVYKKIIRDWNKREKKDALF
jgi:hypothetical protein